MLFEKCIRGSIRILIGLCVMLSAASMAEDQDEFLQELQEIKNFEQAKKFSTDYINDTRANIPVDIYVAGFHRFPDKDFPEDGLVRLERSRRLLTTLIGFGRSLDKPENEVGFSACDVALASHLSYVSAWKFGDLLPSSLTVTSTSQTCGERSEEHAAVLNAAAVATMGSSQRNSEIDLKRLRLARDILCEKFGCDDPRTAVVQTNIAYQFYLGGDYRRAESELGPALEILTRAPGYFYEIAISGNGLLCDILLELGEEDAARAFALEQYKFRIKDGSSEESLADALNRYGAVIKDPKEANILLSRALSIRTTALEEPLAQPLRRYLLIVSKDRISSVEKHAKRLAANRWGQTALALAERHYAQGQYDETVKYASMALDKLRYEPLSKTVAGLLAAEAEVKRNNQSRASDFLMTASSMIELSPDHPYRARFHLLDAQIMMKSALDMRSKYFFDPRPYRALSEAKRIVLRRTRSSRVYDTRAATELKRHRQLFELSVKLNWRLANQSFGGNRSN